MVVKGYCDYTNDYCNTVTVNGMSSNKAFKVKKNHEG